MNDPTRITSDELPDLPGAETHPNRHIATAETNIVSPADVDRLGDFWTKLEGVHPDHPGEVQASVFDATALVDSLADELFGVLDKLRRAGVPFVFVGVGRIVVTPKNEVAVVEQFSTFGESCIVPVQVLAPLRMMASVAEGEEGFQLREVSLDSNEGVILTTLLDGHGVGN